MNDFSACCEGITSILLMLQLFESSSSDESTSITFVSCMAAAGGELNFVSADGDNGVEFLQVSVLFVFFDEAFTGMPKSYSYYSGICI